MMRDKIKNIEYFDAFIEEDLSRIKKFTDKLNSDEVKEERILPVKTKIHDLKLGILIARYSKGEELNQMKEECNILFDGWTEVWQPEFYIKNLWLISLGVLLNISDDKLDVVRGLLVQSDMEDWLYDILLNFKKVKFNDIKNKLIFPEVYDTLKDMVYSAENQIDLLRHYIQKEWYDKHRDCGWYDAHKGSQNTYYGYWSFESGAISKILKLDDEELKQQQYYPYDLVHFND